ncbi:hypothetical protein Leryth_010391 [Lithospermum erythrorhizon]|nr:hypothetical protein Leryth_010391 [Lithospermum erythrorhizon]
MGDQNHEFTLDEALSAVGVGNFHAFALLYAGLGWASDAIEMMLLSIVGPAVQSEWGLSPGEESLLSSVVFVGMLVGAYFWGLISDVYGRRKGFIGAIISTALAGFFSTFSYNYNTLLILRCLLGFGVGGGHVFTSWFLEFAPVSSRGAWTVSISIFWTTGTIFEASLAWIIMPRLGWRWLIALSCLPSLFVLLFAGLTPESPRYLCMKGQSTEARNVLERVALLNQTELPQGTLVSGPRVVKLDEEYASSEDTSFLSPATKHTNHFETSQSSSLFKLFSPKLLKTTLLIWILYFGNVFAYYGIIFLTSELSSGKNNCNPNTNVSVKSEDDTSYMEIFITSLAELPSVFLSAAIVDRVGRKYTMGITSVLSFVFLLPLVWHHNEMITTTLLFGARLFISAGSTVVSVYAMEVYPTPVRSTGVGVASSVGRIGGIICPLVSVGLLTLLQESRFLPFFFFFLFKMREETNVFTLDGALTALGFGKFQALLLIYGGLGWISDAMEMQLLSYIGPALRAEWNLTSSQESVISTVVFGGMLLGAYTWGYLSDAYGRKKSFQGVIFFAALAGLLASFAPSYYYLLVLRGVAGFGLGGALVFQTWFLEFVPTLNRGSWMTVFYSFWTIGTISEAGLAWIVMPTRGWRWLVGLSAVPAFCVLLSSFFVPESPRYLGNKGRWSEAHAILKKGSAINKKSLPNGTLVSDQDAQQSPDEPSPEGTVTEKKEAKTGLSSVTLLFSKKLLRTTLLLWVIFFGLTFSYYGIILLTSELSSPDNKCRSTVSMVPNSKPDDSLYITVFITSLAEIPGLAISAFIVDRIGRKISMVMMFGFCFALLLPLVTYQSRIITTVLLFGARMFISATFNVLSLYAPEVYPTNIRSTGVGIASSVGRIGGMVCPMVAVGLVTGCHQALAILLLGGVLVVSAICIMFVPLETKNRALCDSTEY